MPTVELKIVPGIKPGLTETYDFEDQAWSRQGDPRYEPKYRYLSSVCVALASKSGGFLVKSRMGNSWQAVGKKEFVVAKLYQEWAGMVMIDGVAHSITLDDIRDYLAKGLTSFDGTCFVPLHGPFVLIRQGDQCHRLVNLWNERRVTGDDDHIAHLENFLRLVRESLCGATDSKDLSGMLQEIVGPEPTPFKWVVHWLAVPYQKPGATTQTNLWFIGRRGTGKGTLVAVMNRILGSVGKVDDEEIKRGWNDHMFGHLLVEWDEFEDTWHSFLGKIKKYTGNETVQYTRRNFGQWVAPNVSQHIFSTNKSKPLQVEHDDRQNTFIATTEDAEKWQSWVSATFWDRETNALADPRIVTGFAALLGSIEIDWGFIKKPLKTDLRAEYVEAFADLVETWLANDRKLKKRFNEALEFGLECIYDDYREWVKQYDPNRKPDNFRDWKAKMKKLKRLSRKQKRVGGKLTWFPMVMGPGAANQNAENSPRIVAVDGELCSPAGETILPKGDWEDLDRALEQHF